jgi:hypothetical protein
MGYLPKGETLTLRSMDVSWMPGNWALWHSFCFSGSPVTIRVNMHIKSMGSVSETDQVCKKFLIFTEWSKVKTSKSLSNNVSAVVQGHQEVVCFSDALFWQPACFTIWRRHMLPKRQLTSGDVPRLGELQILYMTSSSYLLTHGLIILCLCQPQNPLTSLPLSSLFLCPVGLSLYVISATCSHPFYLHGRPIPFLLLPHFFLIGLNFNPTSEVTLG